MRVGAELARVGMSDSVVVFAARLFLDLDRVALGVSDDDVAINDRLAQGCRGLGNVARWDDGDCFAFALFGHFGITHGGSFQG